jgi:thioredoxin 1
MTAFPLIDASQLPAVTARPGVVLLDFWQASCAPCRALEPRLDRLSDAHPDEFQGYRIDVDTDQDTVTAYQVTSIPTIVLLRDGHEVARLDALIRDPDLEQALGLALSPGG